MVNLFATKPNLRSASRLPELSREASVSFAELACLLACGAFAAIGVGMLHYSFGIPGSAILRGVLPIALGFAVVPRRSAGITMSVGAGAAAAVMSAAQVGEFQVPALVGTLAFGPALDVALSGCPQGWRLYFRFAGGGAAANLLAYSAKFVGVFFGMHFPGSGRVTHFWSFAFGSFLLCGALAGLVSAVVWFPRESTMIYVGIDDTDTLDDPGTNQLARHIVRELAGQFSGRMILRHQLLEDPRVPCTKKNGCASILFDATTIAQGGWGRAEGEPPAEASQLIDCLRDLIIPWCPAGSDPGFCVATSVPPAVIDWGTRCQRDLVTQQEARQIAADNNIHLEGLGGTEDGVIGALAAIGLMATKNDGRVVYFGKAEEDWYDVTGCLTVEDILSRGVEEILTVDTGQPLVAGTVDIGKRLRPNYRNGKIVLYVARGEAAHWEAVRVK